MSGIVADRSVDLICSQIQSKYSQWSVPIIISPSSVKYLDSVFKNSADNKRRFSWRALGQGSGCNTQICSNLERVSRRKSRTSSAQIRMPRYSSRTRFVCSFVIADNKLATPFIKGSAPIMILSGFVRARSRTCSPAPKPISKMSPCVGFNVGNSSSINVC